MIRNPTLREARAVVKQDAKERRKARKAAASAHIRAMVESKAPGKRDPRQRDNGYLAFLRRCACAICGSTPSDAAHLRFTNPAVGRINPGMGRKSHDRFAVSLCRTHHTEQHAEGNEPRWWASHGIDPGKLAASLYAAFLGGQEPPQAVVRIRETARRNKSDPQ